MVKIDANLLKRPTCSKWNRQLIAVQINYLKQKLF